MAFTELATSFLMTTEPEPRKAKVPMATALGSIRLQAHNADAVDVSASLLAFNDNAVKLMQCTKGQRIAVAGELMANEYQGSVRLQIKVQTIIAANHHDFDYCEAEDDQSAIDDQSADNKLELVT